MVSLYNAQDLARHVPGSDFQHKHSEVPWNTSRPYDLDIGVLQRKLEHRRAGRIFDLHENIQSVSPREAKDVAAAARFRHHIDHLNRLDDARALSSQSTLLQGPTPPKLRAMVSADNLSGISKSRLTRVRDSQSVMRQRKLGHSSSSHPDQQNSSFCHHRPDGQLPVRTSSRSAPSFVCAKVDQTADSRTTLRQTQAASTLSSPEDVPPVPPLSAARFLHTPRRHSPVAPGHPPFEDSDLQNSDSPPWDETQVVVPEQRRSRKLAQMLSSEPRPQPRFQLGYDKRTVTVRPETRQVITPPTHDQKLSTRSKQVDKPSSRKKRNIFGWLQKKSEVDELIDLYMNQDSSHEHIPASGPATAMAPVSTPLAVPVLAQPRIQPQKSIPTKITTQIAPKPTTDEIEPQSMWW